jgi:hypothetical protein
MKLTEERCDLFSVGGDYYLAHCIASDLALGAGIAVPMQKIYGLRTRLQTCGISLMSPTCILTGRVFNLITKSKSRGKPTYLTLLAALEKMMVIAVQNNIKKIAMPRIGCGLDKLEWDRVKSLIEKVFQGKDIEILVCVWK